VNLRFGIICLSAFGTNRFNLLWLADFAALRPDQVWYFRLH